MTHHYRACLALMTLAVLLLGAGYHGQSQELTKARRDAKEARSEAATLKRLVERQKIAPELNRLDIYGFRGSGDGKVSVSYEFRIPDTKRCRDEVRRVDASVRFYPGVSGHIGAQKGQYLCIGSTNQASWRAVLSNLAALPYVERIIEAYFE